MGTLKKLSVAIIIAISASQISCQDNEVFKSDEPIEYKNLQIFFIRGKASLEDKNYIPLSEAIEKDYVTIYETGNVEELSADNSSNSYVYINSGDIVKGGKQDRTIRYDVILPPNSTKLPLSSFCVESGRWEKRESEDQNQFSKNDKVLSSRKLKTAAKYNNDQMDVWGKVSEQQEKLNENVSKIKGFTVNVKSGASSSSLQLTLEDKDLISITEEYKNHLLKLPHDQSSVLGFAYAINGEIYSIDIFNNNKLFIDYWEKLLDAAIVEAISEYTENNDKIKSDEVIEHILNKNYNHESTNQINSTTTFLTYKDKENLLFITKDNSKNSTWIHKNYLKLDKD